MVLNGLIFIILKETLFFQNFQVETLLKIIYTPESGSLRKEVKRNQILLPGSQSASILIASRIPDMRSIKMCIRDRDYPDPPEMPKKLPKLVELLISRTPQIYKPAVAHAIFPPLATHLWKTRFRYIDNVEHEARPVSYTHLSGILEAIRMLADWEPGRRI